MNDSLTHQEYISYTLHHPQQPMGYTTLNGTTAQQLGGHQQQYGVMHSHSDLLQQAASGLLATEAPDGPIMMSPTVGSTSGVLLTLNGTGAMHNGAAGLHQSSQQGSQYGALASSGSPLGTVVVSTNPVLGSPQPATQSAQNSHRSSTSANSNSTNNSPPIHHSSKKKRKCYSIEFICLFFSVHTAWACSCAGRISHDLSDGVRGELDE